MPTDSDTSESFKRFSEDYARNFRSQYRDSALQMIASQKTALEQVNQFLREHHEAGSAEFSKFIKTLMAGQLEGLKLLREAEERAFDLQSGMIQSYLRMLDQLKSSLEGEASSDDGRHPDS